MVLTGSSRSRRWASPRRTVSRVLAYCSRMLGIVPPSVLLSWGIRILLLQRSYLSTDIPVLMTVLGMLILRERLPLGGSCASCRTRRNALI